MNSTYKEHFIQPEGIRYRAYLFDLNHLGSLICGEVDSSLPDLFSHCLLPLGPASLSFTSLVHFRFSGSSHLFSGSFLSFPLKKINCNS